MSGDEAGHGFNRGRKPAAAPSAVSAPPGTDDRQLVIDDTIWRNIFAGLVMQAIVQGVAPTLAGTSDALEEVPTAEVAVKFADALLAALKKSPASPEA